MKKVAENDNFEVTDTTIKVANYNTYNKSVTTNDGTIRDGYIYFYDSYNNQINTPFMTSAGAGSVKLNGTFSEVSFKLIHRATPFSEFPEDEYYTHEAFFANYMTADGSGIANGDGVNGLNKTRGEKFAVGIYQVNQDLTNSDLFRASLRLLKPSTLGGSRLAGCERG